MARQGTHFAMKICGKFPSQSELILVHSFCLHKDLMVFTLT